MCVCECVGGGGEGRGGVSRWLWTDLDKLSGTTWLTLLDGSQDDVSWGAESFGDNLRVLWQWLNRSFSNTSLDR